MENRRGDLWSIFDFLNPGLLGSATRFKSFVKTLENGEHPNYAPLRKLVAPYILRRLKTDPDIVPDPVRRWPPPFLILSVKAGGTGLNLTAASHVIHFDRWWNPAVENQATDRAFRIGQQRNVLVHKFVTRGTMAGFLPAPRSRRVMLV